MELEFFSCVRTGAAAVLTELSQLPTFFGFFALIFIVKPRVFIVAF